jgi:hypothetical protein
MMRVFILVIASFPPRVLRAKRVDHWQQDGWLFLSPQHSSNSRLDLSSSPTKRACVRVLLSILRERWHNFRPAAKSDFDGASEVKATASECYVIFMQTIAQIEQFSYINSPDSPQ